MSKRSTGLTLSYAVDSASEDEGSDSFTGPARARATSKSATAMPTPDSANENAQQQRRRGRPKGAVSGSAIKPTKAPGRRTSAGSVLGAKRAAVKKNAAAGKRQALAEVTNVQETDDIEEVDDFDDLAGDGGAAVQPLLPPPSTAKQPAKRGRAAKPKDESDKAKNKRGRAAEVAVPESREIPETQQDLAVQSKLARNPSATTKKPRPAKREIIPETQPEPMEVEESLPAHQSTDTLEELAQDVDRPAPYRTASTARNRQPPVTGRRAGSASDTERGGNEPTLRRKLGDVNKKLETLELKYSNLRELGLDDAETSFDKLKRQTDEKTKAANELIASLRSDLKTQFALTSELTSLRTQISTLIASQEAVTSEKKTLQSTLHEAQNEIKTLQAKLAATRASSTTIHSTEGGKVPGSAVKNRNAPPRTVLVGSVEAAREAQKRALKEELYGDLTGLILRDVKRREEEGEDVYDCIQTGRNGTLHFHLTVANPSPNSTNTNSSTNNAAPPPLLYEDAEFQYTPLLDERRDRDLLEILPDYLTEEICFPRSNAAKFYARVVDCLTKRVEVVEAEE